MTAVDVPISRISAEARDVQFGRTVATVVGGVLFAVGWLAAKAWFAVVWCAFAVRAGFRDGRGAAASPATPARRVVPEAPVRPDVVTSPPLG